MAAHRSSNGYRRGVHQATQKGYEYAYANPDDAAQILVDEAPDANLKPEFVKKSMQVIVDGQYWGEPVLTGFFLKDCYVSPYGSWTDPCL